MLGLEESQPSILEYYYLRTSLPALNELQQVLITKLQMNFSANLHRLELNVLICHRFNSEKTFLPRPLLDLEGKLPFRNRITSRPYTNSSLESKAPTI